jgi:hypothetical protein
MERAEMRAFVRGLGEKMRGAERRIDRIGRQIF